MVRMASDPKHLYLTSVDINIVLNDIPPSFVCWCLYRFVATIALGRFNSIIVDGCICFWCSQYTWDAAQVGLMGLLSVLFI